MKFKKIISLVTVIAVALVTFTSCGGNTANEGGESTSGLAGNSQSKSIVVLDGASTKSFSKALREGAQEAGKRMGYTVTFRSAGEQDNNTDEAQFIKNAVDGNTAGIIIATENQGLSDALISAYYKNIPIVEMCEGITDADKKILSNSGKNPVVSTVSGSYKEAGSTVADTLFEKIKGEIEKSEGKYLVGIIANPGKHSSVLTAQGFQEKLAEVCDADEKLKDKYEIRVEDDLDKAYTTSLTDLVEDDVKAVFMTDREIGEEISDYVSNEGKDIQAVFCGFDSGAKQVKWLKEDNSRFIGGVSLNAYDIGYNAVEQCINAIEGKSVKENVQIAMEWYDGTNIDKLVQENKANND